MGRPGQRKNFVMDVVGSVGVTAGPQLVLNAQPQFAAHCLALTNAIESAQPASPSGLPVSCAQRVASAVRKLAVSPGLDVRTRTLTSSSIVHLDVLPGTVDSYLALARRIATA